MKTTTNGNGHPRSDFRMHDAVLHARIERIASQLTANNTSLSRGAALQQLLDPRRDIDDECGYPPIAQAVGIDIFRQLYDRDAVAAKVVQYMPKAAWQVTPILSEDEDAKSATPFEQAWDELEVNKSGGTSWHQDDEGSTVWEQLFRANTLARIGHFGVILLGIDDGKNLQDPVDAVEVLNRKAEPITRNVAGKKVVIGHRMKVTRRSPLMPDCEVTNAERERLEAMIADPRLTVNHVDPNSGKQTETTHELQYLNSWHPEATRNVVTPPPKSDGAIFGTDQQYTWPTAGGQPLPSAMGGPFGGAAGSLSGTDQQYFGVQFGPSQQMGDKPKGKEHKLVFMRCFDESLVQVVRWEWSVRNPRFGQPVMYRITLNDPREVHSGVGLPLATVFVHWSRVIHIADNLGSSEVMGVPAMRPVLNHLLDLRKVYAADGEGFWRNGILKLFFETHPQLGGEVQVDVDGMRDQLEQMMNGLQQWMVTTGMSAKAVPPAISDPTAHVAVHIEAICIQLNCPVRVFKGSERGELASSQDDSQWNDMVRHYQLMFVTPRVIVPFIDRLIMLKVLPEPEGYSIRWPGLDSLSDKDRAGIALTNAQAVSAYVAGNCEALVPPIHFLTSEHFLGMDESEAEAMLDEAEKQQEQDLQDKQDFADDHGMIATPPPGFQHKPAPGQPGSGEPAPEKPAIPVALNPGQKLIDPASGKTVASGNPPPNPANPKQAGGQPAPAANALERRDDNGRFISDKKAVAKHNEPNKDEDTDQEELATFDTPVGSEHVLGNYNPDQARDDHGRWTAGGAADAISETKSAIASGDNAKIDAALGKLIKAGKERGGFGAKGLKELAKAHGITGHSSMTKAKLVAAIHEKISAARSTPEKDLASRLDRVDLAERGTGVRFSDRVVNQVIAQDSTIANSPRYKEAYADVRANGADAKAENLTYMRTLRQNVERDVREDKVNHDVIKSALASIKENGHGDLSPQELRDRMSGKQLKAEREIIPSDLKVRPIGQGRLGKKNAQAAQQPEDYIDRLLKPAKDRVAEIKDKEAVTGVPFSGRLVHAVVADPSVDIKGKAAYSAIASKMEAGVRLSEGEKRQMGGFYDHVVQQIKGGAVPRERLVAALEQLSDARYGTLHVDEVGSILKKLKKAG